jgi:hypothetical protein
MNPTVSVTSKSSVTPQALTESLNSLKKKQVYVGIPATDAMERKRQVLALSRGMRGRRKKRAEKMAVESGINNAELTYIHTHGSALRGIPPRPIIEPAIEDRENQEKILPELELAAKAALDGKSEEVVRELNLAGIVATNAVKKWFVNPKNNWAPNAPSTIRAKGSSRPLIDTAALRQAMTYVVGEE